MSRKIGLCDIHFDPDIEGEIDFDFFNDDHDEDGREENGMTASTCRDMDGSTTQISGISATETAINGETNRYDDHEGRLSKQNDAGERTTMSSRGRPVKESTSQSPNDDHDDEYTRTMRELHLGLSSDCLESVQVACSSMRDDEDDYCCSSSQERVRNSVVANWAIDTPMDHRMATHADHQQQQPPMERSLTPKELLRVTATELRFGSPLSSESGSDSASDLYSLTDSLDDDEENSRDASDSEITDVSPLSSANMSPLPESPRRRTPEPSSKRSSKFGSFSPRPGLSGGRRLAAAGLQCCNGGPKPSVVVGSADGPASSSGSKETSVDLKLLAKAILELEEERKLKRGSSADRSSLERDSNAVRSRSSSMLGHESAGRMMSNSGRKNLSFTNDEVRRIEQENKRLLRRIIDSQKTRRSSQPPPTTGKLASSAVNRMRDLKKIEAENLAMLKRLQAAKPTKELSRDFLLKTTGGHRSGSSCSGSLLQDDGGGSSHQQQQQQQMMSSARARHGAGGRSLSTGSITSSLASCSSSNRNYSGRSRSLKLPNASVVAVAAGFGQQGPAAAAAGGGNGR